jgi:CO/xanthine dehydrogenase Mo-binding subunit
MTDIDQKITPENTEERSVVGTSPRRIDAIGKVTGKALFAEDHNRPNQLWGAVLRAEHPHANILNIDVSQAKKYPWVRAILTHYDVPGEVSFGQVTVDQRVLADDKVRYLGDGVVIAAATSREAAREALKKVKVTYQPLPVVDDPVEALKQGSVLIHDGGNQIAHHRVRKGDVAEGFAQADIVIERSYRTPFVEHAYLEPEAVLAEPGPHGGIRVIGSIQNIYSTRTAMAQVLNLPLSKVEVIQATLGGSFGGKDQVMTVMCCRAAMLSLATGRPVKMVNSREESFLESYKRHPYIMNYKVGATRNGHLTAVEIDIVADGGAYDAMSSFVTWRSAVHAAGPYQVPHVKTDVRAAYTNNTYASAMRGFGSPQVDFAVEAVMDELADELGMDPLRFRLMNVFQEGSITATGQKLTGVVSVGEALEKAAREADWEQKRTEFPRQNNPTRKGIGIACSYRGVSLGAEGVDQAATIVSVQKDGSVIVSSGIVEMGQGAATQMCVIVAEVLGIGLDRIQFLDANTSRIPDSGPTVASRGTIMGGGAARLAALEVRQKLLETAAEELGVPEEHLILQNNRINPHYGDPKPDAADEQGIPFRTAAELAYEKGHHLMGIGWYRAPKTDWDEETGQGNAYFTYVYGANVAEVSIDTETGEVTVHRVTSAHDVGRAIYRAGVEGQITGGVAMGMGYGLLEEYPHQSAVPEFKNFDEYLLPTSMDVPEVTSVILEHPDPAGPFGAKSIGEPATELAAPAIINAIAHATGKRIRQLPANLEMVLLGKKLSRHDPRQNPKASGNPSADGSRRTD